MNSIKQSIEQLCQENKIRQMYVFGSRAREVLALFNEGQESLPGSSSDVDIGVLTKIKLTVKEKVHLALTLEELLHVTRVDLVVLSEADPFLAANIIRGERLYAADSYEADEYDLYILRRAGDLAPFERERMALILHEEPPKYDAH